MCYVAIFAPEELFNFIYMINNFLIAIHLLR